LGMVDTYYTGPDMNAEVGRGEKALSTVVPTVHQASVYYLSIYVYIYFFFSGRCFPTS